MTSSKLYTKGGDPVKPSATPDLRVVGDNTEPTTISINSDAGMFYVINNKTYYHKHRSQTSSERAPSRIKLADLPIYPVAWIVGEKQGEEHYIQLSYTDLADNDHIINVPLVALITQDKKDDGIKTLASHGFMVVDRKTQNLSKCLVEAATAASQSGQIPILIGSDITGWINNCKEHITPSSRTYVGKFRDYHDIQGSGQRWYELQRFIFSSCTTTSFIITAAISGYLRGIIGSDHSTIIDINGATSRGKTLAMRCACTWVGDPSDNGGLIHSWKSSYVGRENLAMSRSGAFLAMDELHSLSRQKLCTELMELTNGGGRTVGTMTGGMREAKTWSTVILSSGNTSVDAVTIKDPQHDALQSRTIDINLNEYPLWANGFYNTNPNQLQRELETHFGFGYSEVIKYIKNNKELLKETYELFEQQAFEMFADSAPEIGRRAKNLAFIYCASFIVDSIIGTEENQEPALNVRNMITTMLEKWNDEASNKSEDATTDIKGELVHILTKYIKHVAVDGYWYDKTLNQESVAKNQTSNAAENGIHFKVKQSREMLDHFDLCGTVYIPKTKLQEVEQAGVDLQDLVAKASEQGLLVSNKGRKTLRDRQLGACYVFKIIGDAPFQEHPDVPF